MAAKRSQGLKGTSVAVSADYGCNGSEGCVRMTTGATDKTVTLPSAVLGPQLLVIEKVDAGAGGIDIAVLTGERFEGQVDGGEQVSNQWNRQVCISDGALNWTGL